MGKIRRFWPDDPDDDNDGVEDVDDVCPSTPIELGNIGYAACDAGVEDFLVIDQPGCSVSQQIERLAAGAKNKGQLVSRVAKLLTDLQIQGLLQPQENGPIETCVAQN